ncbi:hypothetical protein CAOG_03581 [Capsaspora owczarzaki ATCC 30864]|uniref:Tim10-like domain-containing protein n=1 Tax=Capsaspora owczarzaki (strain ATCC 30864) TaxID=595528 RepID=A0A0D2X2J4_CAPO3|nr:hypothetical protein CAOG_03581 [Capsaspora owczarzaki ATCC 30864]KJE92664.1 hypothetical protein CAOG_003581 [Capsaspora owczarzaki ATCC 30864]|eukprot:XP_004363309.1 hypothetical protein CAOG_03581 [Capsaspora owczarzaki ATCC 30864]
MDFSGLSPSDQAYMAQVLERKQARLTAIGRAAKKVLMHCQESECFITTQIHDSRKLGSPHGAPPIERCAVASCAASNDRDYRSSTLAQQFDSNGIGMQDFVRMYNHLSERCFSDCVNDFTSRTTTTKEQGCVGRCVQKFVQLSQRVGQRFSEQQALQAEQQAAAAAAGTR